MADIDWGSFTGKTSTRYAMDKPRIIGGVKYATNSHIAISFPTDELDAVHFDGRRFPDVEGVLSQAGIVEEWHQWPKNIPTCKRCKNSGSVSCHKCHGEGVCKCDMGHDHPCNECEGILIETCFECGSYETAIEFGNRRIALRYCQMISKLPAPIAWGISSSPSTAPIVFRFGEGGRGLVMPFMGSHDND